MADNPMLEFAAVFVEEAGGRLTELRRCVDVLAAASTPEECEKARISSHTIRGMSAQMGYDDIARVAKEIELLFVALKKTGSAPGADMVAGVRNCTTALETLFNGLAKGAPATVDADGLVARMQAFTGAIA